MPLQSDWAQKQLGLHPGELPEEIKLIANTGKTYGGIDALLFMAQSVAWMTPLVHLAEIPFLKKTLKAAYSALAKRRYCLSGKCRINPPQ